MTTETQETEPAGANSVPNRQGVPTSGTIPPETGTDAPEYLTDRDPGDEQP